MLTTHPRRSRAVPPTSRKHENGDILSFIQWWLIARHKNQNIPMDLRDPTHFAQ